MKKNKNRNRIKSNSELSTPQEINRYYQQKEVVLKYINKRFSEPLNRIEHQQQVKIINSILTEFSQKNILEIAPGPARITAELNIEGGTSIDSSLEMIKVAQERMSEKGKKWTFLQRDFFSFTPKQKHDFIFTIRFLLHFHRHDRYRIYQKVNSLLQPNGLFLFEAMNKTVVAPLRKVLGKKRYFVYDKLYTESELRTELEKNGFKVLRFYPLLNHFWIQSILTRPFKLLKMNQTAENIIHAFEKFPSPQPYEWIVLCQKK